MDLNPLNEKPFSKLNVFDFKALLSKVVHEKSLSYDESKELAKSIIKGSLSPTLTSAILIALRMKHESPDELAGFAKAMREACIKLNCDKNAIDTAGTGGDGIGTINASTGAALICAAAGVKVIKHGNRSISSKTGSADVLEELGFKILLNPNEAKNLLEKTNFTFAFAPLYHPAIKNVMPIRKELGIRTIFNLLGPLANPALVSKQVIGVFNKEFCKIMAEAVKILGIEKALIIHGLDGIDEVSVSSKTLVYEVSNKRIEEYTITPESLRIKRHKLKEVLGGDAKLNAKLLIKAFSPSFQGAIKDFLIANASVALYLANLSKSIEEGVEIAKQTIDEGLVIKKVLEIVELSGGSINKLKRFIDFDYD